IHVVASRVRFDGAGVPTWQERWRSGAVTREIEQAYDLSHTRRPKRERERDRSTVRERSSERHRAARRGEAPGRLALARRIDQALSGCDGSREDLTRELAASGVETRWHAGRDGRTRGVSFALRD